ncbi:MAG: hypothetical protein Fur0032_01880 [Terrimicrobiaceae bacterium]
MRKRGKPEVPVVPMKEWIPLGVRKVLGGRWDAWQLARRKRALLHSLKGSAVQCNVCGWEGAAFTDDQWHAGSICPNCLSQVRHRLIAGAFDGVSSLPGLDEDTLVRGKDVLHFAPERQLRQRLASAARRYVTADFARGDCDLLLDISAMPSVADQSFDVVIVCDVLEHVPDDRAAMREIRRVLRPEGLAILSVPQADPPSVTDEDASVVSEEERTARFGQKDHVRMYGDDFSRRLEDADFKVQILSAGDFSEELVRRHVLAPPRPNPSPLATNQRRIYFAFCPGTLSKPSRG